MKRLFPILSIFVFFTLISIIIFLKIRNYNFNLSSLILIWKGFAHLNPSYIPSGFVILDEGGYDGQFFFFLAKYFYNFGDLNFPILDSFFFRFHRLGLSWIVGSFGSIFGWQYYPHIALILLLSFHILSSLTLYSLLTEELKYLFYYYLFSPFSILSTTLLVSDSLMVSFCIISLAFFMFGKNFFHLIAASLYMFFALLIKEAAIFTFAPLILFFLFKKNYRMLAYSIPPLLIYLLFYFISQNISFPHLGTYPLQFKDMVDFPLFGFIKSFEGYDPFNWKHWIQNFGKVFLFIIYALLIFNLFNLFRSFKQRNWKLATLLTPLLPILLLITISEQGYWRNFDNLARMFSLTIPIVIIAKSYSKDYKDYGFLNATFILTGIILFRILFITKSMSFTISP